MSTRNRSLTCLMALAALAVTGCPPVTTPDEADAGQTEVAARPSDSNHESETPAAPASGAATRPRDDTNRPASPASGASAEDPNAAPNPADDGALPDAPTETEPNETQSGAEPNALVSGAEANEPSAVCVGPACAGPEALSSTAGYNGWHYTTQGFINELAISGNGRRLVVADHSGDVLLFDATSNTPITHSEMPPWNPPTTVAMSRSGASFVVGTQYAQVMLFECDAEEATWVYDTQAGAGQLVDVAISHNGCFIAATDRRHVHLFSRASATPIATFAPDLTGGLSISTVELSGDGSRVIAGTSIADPNGAVVFAFDHEGLLWSHRTTYSPQTENVVDMPIAVSMDGGLVLASGASRRLYAYDGNTGAIQWTADAHSPQNPRDRDQFSALALSDDGSEALAVGRWEARRYGPTGAILQRISNMAPCRQPSRDLVCEHEFRGHRHAAAISADGFRIVAAAYDAAFIHDRYSPMLQLERFPSATNYVQNVAISADGEWLAMSSTYGQRLRLVRITEP